MEYGIQATQPKKALFLKIMYLCIKKDTYIGRSVFRLNGKVSSANTLTIPDSSEKSL